jgi:hypothetical protein
MSSSHNICLHLLGYMCSVQDCVIVSLVGASQNYSLDGHTYLLAVSRTAQISLDKNCSYILYHVYGSMTNNNGFWIRWLDLLTPSCAICLNHNHITTAHNKWLPKTRYILVLLLILLSQFSHNCQLRDSTLLYPLCTDVKENTACIVDKDCLPLRCLAIDVLLFRAFASAGMCLATLCLAMGMTRTTWKTILAVPFLLLSARISGVA